MQFSLLTISHMKIDDLSSQYTMDWTLVLYNIFFATTSFVL